jgi:hypothetical protein
MLHKPKQMPANIALTTVVIVTAFLLLGGITLTKIGIDLARAGSTHTANLQLQIQANNCFEEVLRQLNLNSSFTGDYNLDEIDFSCNNNVTNDLVNPLIKIVSTTATSGDYHYSQSKRVNTTTKPYIVLP